MDTFLYLWAQLIESTTCLELLFPLEAYLTGWDLLRHHSLLSHMFFNGFGSCCCRYR